MVENASKKVNEGGRGMEDNRDGLKNRVPFQTDQRVATLSPILDTYAGPQYGYGAFDGRVPDDPCGLAPSGEEVSDDEFRSWPEKKRGR